MSTGFDAICDDCRLAVHIGFLAGGGCYAGYSSHDWVGQRRALAFLFHHAYSHKVRVAQEHPEEYRFLEEDEIDPDTGNPIDPEEAKAEIESDQDRRKRWFVDHFAGAVLGRQWTPTDVAPLRALGVPEDLLPGAVGTMGSRTALDEEQRRILRLTLTAQWEGRHAKWPAAAVGPLIAAGLVQDLGLGDGPGDADGSRVRVALSEAGARVARSL